MSSAIRTVTSLILAVLLVLPSVYMVHVGKVQAEISVQEMAVETFMATAADSLTQCLFMPMILSALGEWLPFLGSGALATSAEAGSASTVASVAVSKAALPTIQGAWSGAIALTVPTLDTISYMQQAVQQQQLDAMTLNTQTTAIATADVSGETSRLSFKACVLDPLVNNIKEKLIDAITADLVAWIEGGFEGEPAFLTHPDQFFKDIGKSAISAFLYDSGMDEFICEPFRVDVVLNFLWDYETPAYSEYGSLSCDLEDVFSDGIVVSVGQGDGTGGISPDTRSSSERYKAAVEDGDFDAIGLTGVAKMLNPNNNEYDQTQHLKAAAAAKSREAVGTEQSMLDQSGGWLSQRCDSDGDGTKEQVCTPGKYIAGQVDQVMGSSLSQLELADEFAEILDALLRYVVTEILTSVSGDYGLLHVRSNV